MSNPNEPVQGAAPEGGANPSSAGGGGEVRNEDRSWDSDDKAEAKEAGKNRPAPVSKASGGQHNADKAAESAPGDRREGEDLEERQDCLLDEAVEETFPASDPIAPKRIT